MSKGLHLLASNALTLLGIGMLAASVLALGNTPSAAGAMLGAFALLAVNLLAALMVHPRLRRDAALFMLHLSLLGLLLLAGVGRLARYEAHVELVDGQSLADTVPEVLVRGPWHEERMSGINFIQGYFTVDYTPGLRRGDTRSWVRVNGRQQWLGDEDALVLSGYRFTTTHNKGYAALLAWLPEQGEAVRGAVNLPGYPLFEGNQVNRFQPPGGPALDVAFEPEGRLPSERAWRLDSRTARGSLRVRLGGGDHVLVPGQTLVLPGGTLRFEGMRGWMGYRVFHDPTLPWLFASATLALGGLLWHLLAVRVGRRETGHGAGEAAHAA